MPGTRPNQKLPRFIPEWIAQAFLIVVPFCLIGIVVARVGASTIVNPSTGQIYRIDFAKSQSTWYVDYWHYVIYQALTIPTGVVMVLALGAIVYGAVKDRSAFWRAVKGPDRGD